MKDKAKDFEKGWEEYQAKKQKEIEEIQKVINYCCNVYDEKNRHIRNKCNTYDCEYYDETNGVCCSFGLKEATALYEQGYRKIDKDSVVLSRAEYENKEIVVEMSSGDKLRLTIGKFSEMNKFLEEHIRKETAEKIVNRLIEILSTAMGVCSGCALQQDKAKNPTAREFQFGKYKGFEVAIKEIKELAKQFGVEIKE